MNKIQLQIAGFKMGMLEKSAGLTDILSNPWGAGLTGLGAGAGLGALGYHLFNKNDEKEEEKDPLGQGLPNELSPEEQYLYNLYGYGY